MRIVLDIPDVFAEGILRIISGGELVAKKHPDHDYWIVKENRCNNCGECCLNVDFTCFGADEEGKCNALEKRGDKWFCSKFIDRPFRCIDDPVDPEDLKCCSITHKKVPNG